MLRFAETSLICDSDRIYKYSLLVGTVGWNFKQTSYDAWPFVLAAYIYAVSEVYMHLPPPYSAAAYSRTY